jgi:hypothetical protein
MTEVLQDRDRDDGARDAAAAIDAVLDQRCPDMKMAFWRAVEKHYRQTFEPGHPPSAAPGAGLDPRPASAFGQDHLRPVMRRA